MVKCFGFFTIALGEIPVQVEVLRIASKALFPGAILLDPRKCSTVLTAANIINRYKSDGDIIREFYFV